jgi:MoxR-like ATPase
LNGWRLKGGKHVKANEIADTLKKIKENIASVIIGLEDIVDMMIVSMLSGGHILLEGPPGLGKTTLANTFAESIGGSFKRIQMTPDLLPSDILGVNVYNPFDYTWVLRRGPIFSNIVLIDELNRASPKVQSAFLQVMQERQVTIENETLEIDPPFMVLATQLPVGALGTYPLTSVQIDRFAYRVELGNPEIDKEIRILSKVDDIDAGPVSQVVSGEDILELMEEAKKVHIEESLLRYIVEIIQDVRSNRYVRLGPSPRASIWIYKGARAKALMDSRNYVIPDDIKQLVPFVVLHRVELNQEARLQEINTMNIVNETLHRVPVPKGLD